MSIGERIIELRRKCDLSQGQLASLLDISRQAVSKWENDSSSPDTLKLIKLADILDTDVEYLATGRHPIIPAPPEPEKIIEIQEKIVEKIIEKPVVQIVEKEVEKPVMVRVVRWKYLRNPLEFIGIACVCFALGVLVGFFMK